MNVVGVPPDQQNNVDAPSYECTSQPPTYAPAPVPTFSPIVVNAICPLVYENTVILSHDKGVELDYSIAIEDATHKGANLNIMNHS